MVAAALRDREAKVEAWRGSAGCSSRFDPRVAARRHRDLEQGASDASERFASRRRALRAFLRFPPEAGTASQAAPLPADRHVVDAVIPVS